MSEKEVKIHKDLLFVALTRVPTIMGIPYMAFVMEMMFASLVIIIVGKPLYLLLVVSLALTLPSFLKMKKPAPPLSCICSTV
jgi:type IV secretory pathway VirB3-like protein